MSDKLKQELGYVIQGSGLWDNFWDAVEKQEPFHLEIKAKYSVLPPLVVRVVESEIRVAYKAQGLEITLSTKGWSGNGWEGVDISRTTPQWHSIDDFVDQFAGNGNFRFYTNLYDATYQSDTHGHLY